jgi:hypothetical protein
MPPERSCVTSPGGAAIEGWAPRFEDTPDDDAEGNRLATTI